MQYIKWRDANEGRLLRSHTWKGYEILSWIMHYDESSKQLPDFIVRVIR